MSFNTVTMLDAATGTGAGTAHPNGESDMTFVASQTGGTNATVLVEGSQDNTNWFTVHSFALTNDDAAQVIKEKWRYLRGNVSAITGGSVTLTKTS